MPHLPPELQAQSPWLLFHIPLFFVAYLLLAVASGTGILFLIEERLMKSKRLIDFAWKLPSLDAMDTFIHRLIVWAFPMLTLGILLGAHWAHQAWGRFWAWDPKETFSFITWMTYLLFLAARWMKGWRGRKSIYLSLAGFVLVLLTFGAVSLMTSKHNFN